MKTYTFKLYQHKRNRHLKRQINLAGIIYNHCIALHRRYYRLYGKTLNVYQLMKHITKLKRLPKYSHWNSLGSQAIQDIAQRIARGYTLFFRNRERGIKASPPSFKKVKKYKSFTLKQAGYTLYPDNRIRIGDRIYKYHKSREMEGKVKTVTVKRDPLGDLYIYVVCDTSGNEILPRTGKSVGYDFGLRTFLTASDGNHIVAPEFFKEEQNEIAKLNRELSRKQEGSNHYMQARRRLAKAHKRIADKRQDFHFKLALNLAGEYATICIEDLDIKAMHRLWGKKVSDLSHRSFIKILKYQCSKTGSTVVEIPRFYPSSKTCSVCEDVYEELTLGDRKWTCPNCNSQHDRDQNAAINIHRVGASTLGVETISPAEAG